MRRSTRQSLRKLREIVREVFEGRKCMFCKEPLLNGARKNHYRPGMAEGSPIDTEYTLHHMDGDHHNNDPKNRSWVHRKCHRSFHLADRHAKRREMKVLEKSASKRYTLGVVYEPDTLDTQHEFAKAEDIESAAWDFMTRLQDMAKSGSLILKSALDASDQGITIDVTDMVDIVENDELSKSSGLDDEHLQVGDYEQLGTIVESYIAPVDMVIQGETIKKGAWLLGVRWTPPMFDKIQKGERTGLSMFGRTDKVKE